MNPPPSPHEARRLAMLRELDVLDTDREAAFDALTACAARLTGCPIALVSLVDADRQWFKSATGLDGLRETPRSSAFCSHAIDGSVLFVVEDAHADARFRDNPLVVAPPHVRFYAGQPLVIDGLSVGTLCVLDPAPRTVTEASRDALAQLGHAAVELLQSRRRLRDAYGQRERLLDFARAAGDWMWESDAQHRYVWLSEPFQSQTGLETRHLIGRPIADAPLLDERGEPRAGGPGLIDLLARHEDFNRVITDELTARGRLLLSRSAVVVRAADGGFAGYRGTVRNVSTAVGAAAAARRSEDILRLATAQVPGALFTYGESPDGGVQLPFLSEGAARLLGVTVAELHADPTLYFRLVHPDDTERVRAEMIACGSGMRDPFELLYRIRRPDGSVRWVETRATATRQPDGSKLTHGFTADVTERQTTRAALREAEERWQLAADAAAIGIAHFRRGEGLLHFDARARANHGLRPAHGSITFEDWLAQIDPADRDAAAQGVQQALADGTPFEGRYRIHRPDGSLRWLEFVVRATRAVDGAVDGLVGTCRDVHEQQLAGVLEQQKLEAERANRAKTAFLSRMSHELFTPLNAMLGFAQLMALDAQHPLPVAQQRRLDSVRQAGRQMLSLTDDMLTWSAIERPEFALALDRVDLDEAVHASLAALQPLLQERRVSLAITGVTAASAACVHGEATRLRQVLGKLLTHAVRGSAAGGTVTLAVAAQDNSEVVLRIDDQGGGLNAEQLARLFEPLDRLDADKPPLNDSGLALVIARRLVELMEGRLDIESVPGVGSTFVVHLRRCEALAAPTPEPPAAAAGPPAAAGAPGPTRHVLYIEDEPLNQVLLQEVFRARPRWHLEVASDGAGGLELLQHFAPDLVLMDMNLPDTNGLALIARLRADALTRRLRCIALSADAMSEQIEAARRAGFDDYWTKPIDVSRVLAALDVLLDGAAP